MKRKIAVVALLLLGLLQMAGDLLGITSLQAVAAATGASPAPKVFSSVRGLETFSSRFIVLWRDRSGTERSLRVTTKRSSAIRGPYNREMCMVLRFRMVQY